LVKVLLVNLHNNTLSEIYCLINTGVSKTIYIAMKRYLHLNAPIFLSIQTDKLV